MGVTILQTLLLLLIAFLIGAAIGCILRRLGGDAKPVARPVTKAGDAKRQAEPAIMTIPDPMTGLTVIEPLAPSEEKPASSKPAAKSAPKKPATAGKAASGASNASAAKAAKPGTAKAKATKPRAPKPKAGRAKAAQTKTRDDLKLISGIGKLNEDRLNKAGVSSFAQIAAWTKKDIATFDETLNFKGRIEREDWVGQARTLARGGQTEFSARGAKAKGK
ncbi:MAG: hypothetical protein AB7O39_03995 [Flavobacteriaceae bacterium]